MKVRCNKYIREALEMARQLIILADEGDLDSEDDGCRVLYGVLRDCAYKIRSHADREREMHKHKGVWDDAQKLVDNSRAYDSGWPKEDEAGDSTERLHDCDGGNLSERIFSTGNY